ncbi:RNA polymerase sigma factor FliA [Sansalvadorimonas sp. 2012CJ34-2]|uniref:RNA polymerase sigma factor FliA n=1 Tax=Parendozoicomonas callyspongiae TaxID=2942213 RepID=A0ABT0PD36_9GAMM|nr:RNA polymerase sigma factor FliA [Sansalvadorimonas sp. 2012CJ34-2]MCL6269285.1 RNA polymerase sigma factor FliA [Sansalvadorimonas sp. 2012CJ34-2]
MEALVQNSNDNSKRKQLSLAERTETVTKHAPLVKRIARHLSARMPASVQVDDLVQAGMVGLLEAAGKYDASKGASFETFAGIRIRGAMLDEIRRGDWGPRSVYRNSRRVSEAIQHVEARLGRDARDAEVAAELQVSLDEYFNMVKDLRGCRLFSFEDMFDSEESRLQRPGDGNTPDADLQDEKFRQALLNAIKTLPEREQLVLTLYYEKELNLKEIGKLLGVSESRVSQIHSQAALRLRGRLQNWK